MDSRRPTWLEKAKQVYVKTAKDIAGDVFDACKDDGTGLAQLVGLASFRAQTDEAKIGSFRFFSEKIFYIENSEYVQQIMEFQHDSVHGNDTTNTFDLLFGP